MKILVFMQIMQKFLHMGIFYIFYLFVYSLVCDTFCPTGMVLSVGLGWSKLLSATDKADEQYNFNWLCWFMTQQYSEHAFIVWTFSQCLNHKIDK